MNTIEISFMLDTAENLLSQAQSYDIGREPTPGDIATLAWQIQEHLYYKIAGILHVILAWANDDHKMTEDEYQRLNALTTAVLPSVAGNMINVYMEKKERLGKE